MFEACYLIFQFDYYRGIKIKRFDMVLRRDFGFLKMFKTVINYRDC